MSDDIVARVRVWSAWLDERCPDTAVRDDLREAADEIERLRNERDDARKRLVLLIADLGRGGLPRYQNLIRNSHRLDMDFVNLVWSVINTELETDER